MPDKTFILDDLPTPILGAGRTDALDFQRCQDELSIWSATVL